MDLFLFQTPKDDEPQAAPVLSMESLSIKELAQVRLDFDCFQGHRKQVEIEIICHCIHVFLCGITELHAVTGGIFI